MTDTAFFERMDALASRLLDKFGTPCTLRTITKSKPNAQGKVTETPSDAPGLAVRTESEEILKLFDTAANFALVVKCPNGAAPKTESLIIHAGQTMKILEVKAKNPTGDRLLVSFLRVGAA